LHDFPGLPAAGVLFALNTLLIFKRFEQLKTVFN
jgi:hypothetical protein